MKLGKGAIQNFILLVQNCTKWVQNKTVLEQFSQVWRSAAYLSLGRGAIQNIVWSVQNGTKWWDYFGVFFSSLKVSPLSELG